MPLGAKALRGAAQGTVQRSILNVSAFRVVGMKCKVWNVPSLFALMEVTSAGIPQDHTSAPAELCLQFDEVG